MSVFINSNAVELPHVNDQMSIFPTKTVRTIAMPARLGSHPHFVLHTTRYGVLDMFDRFWDCVGGWSEWYAEVERLDRLRISAGIRGVYRNFGRRETIFN
jgi:hypothetical protein